MPKVDVTTWRNVENALKRGAEAIYGLLEEMVVWPKLEGSPFWKEKQIAELLELLAEEVKDYEDNQARLAEEREERGFTERVQAEDDHRG